MDFRYSPDLEDFQAEVRAFLRDEMAPERTRGHRDERDLTGYDADFERSLVRRAGKRGYLGISVPEEYGGGGKPLSYKAVLSFEASYHDAPVIDTAITLVGSQLLGFGSAAQKAQHVPAVLSGDVMICIAYSEPEAGSDLTRIRTTAQRDGSEFVIDGVKALVTAGHKSELCCLVAVTDPDAPPRKGMSMFLVDLSGPGIRIERRETLNRWTLCDIHFDSARVPADALLGVLNQGWSQMASSLGAERSGMPHMGWATRNLEALTALCRERDLIGDPLVRQQLGKLRAELATGLHFAKRVVWLQDRSERSAHEASMAKVFATELLQRIPHVAAEILGPEATLLRGAASAPADGLFGYELIERIHPAVSVGANELQRDTIAQLGLGLPRFAG